MVNISKEIVNGMYKGECPRKAYEGGFTPPGLAGFIHEWGEDGTCSYCGSMHPDEFFKQVEAGAEIVPTDKGYKAYVMTPSGQKKFYFQHLSRDDQAKFIELLNNKTMKIGYPGYFYTMPFFAQSAVRP